MSGLRLRLGLVLRLRLKWWLRFPLGWMMVAVQAQTLMTFFMMLTPMPFHKQSHVGNGFGTDLHTPSGD